MKDKPRVYISGAITGTINYIERFNKVEKYLSELEYETVNPAKILSYLPITTTHSEYMVVSYALLDICDGIYMMDGWLDSKGAKMEYDYAIRNGKKILYE